MRNTMKKKPIYMYVLLVLSSIGTMLTFQSFFGESKVTLTDEMAAALNLTTALEKKEYVLFLENLIPDLRGPVAWLLLSLLIGALMVVAYFLLGKEDLIKASYAYFGQIGAFVLISLHTLWAYRSNTSVFTSEKLRTLFLGSSMLTFLFSVVVALVFVAIIYFKLRSYRASREGKE